MAKCVKICIEDEEEKKQEEGEETEFSIDQINKLLDEYSKVITKIVSHLTSMDESEGGVDNE